MPAKFGEKGGIVNDNEEKSFYSGQKI